MKAAEALHKRGMYVHMVEKEAHILPRQLTPRTAEFLNEHLSSSGWDIITGEEVTVIHPQHKVELKSGRMLSADLVILAVGTRPAVELARQSELDVRTGIVVDAYFQTSDPKIYAAGDVAETLNLASQQLEVMALLPHAHREGYLAGCNMAGQSKPDPGSILMNSVRLLGWNICSAGAADYRGGELLTWQYQEQLLELKIRDNRLIGYIAINVPEAAGPLTNSVSRKMAISAASWKEFLADGPQLLNIPPVYWQELRRAEAYGSN
jgi:NAD(P)H-nitrite reductase large subunit